MNLASPVFSRPQVLQTETASACQAETLLEAGRRQDKHGERTLAYGSGVLEMPWHKYAIKLSAMGISPSEIAEACDCEATVIYNLLRTDWFLERVSLEMEKELIPMSEFFKKNAVLAGLTLVELMQNPKTPASVRCTSANSLLERHLGKSTQVVQMKTEMVSSDVAADVRRLEEEIEQANNRLFPAGVRSTTA